MQPSPWTLLSAYAGHKSFLDLPKEGVHKTWHFCACSYLEHKPQEERLQPASPCPAKGAIGWCERGCRVAVLGNELDPGSWPDPKGLETPAPSQLTWWHTLQLGPRGPFFFLPALFSVKHLLLRQKAWAGTPLHT